MFYTIYFYDVYTRRAEVLRPRRMGGIKEKNRRKKNITTRKTDEIIIIIKREEETTRAAVDRAQQYTSTSAAPRWTGAKRPARMSAHVARNVRSAA